MPTCCKRPKLILVFPESLLHCSPGQSLPEWCSLPEALGAQLHTRPKVLHLFVSFIQKVRSCCTTNTVQEGLAVLPSGCKQTGLS